MISKWTDHLHDEKAKERFKNQVLAARDVLARLGQILDEKERDLNRKEVSLENYSQPNWAERQAHQNGERSCLYSLKRLIDLDKQIITLDKE